MYFIELWCEQRRCVVLVVSYLFLTINSSSCFFDIFSDTSSSVSASLSSLSSLMLPLSRSALRGDTSLTCANETQFQSFECRVILDISKITHIHGHRCLCTLGSHYSHSLYAASDTIFNLMLLFLLICYGRCTTENVSELGQRLIDWILVNETSFIIN